MVNQVAQDLTARQYAQNIGQYATTNAAAANEAVKKPENQGAEEIGRASCRERV